ncbi:uncharacterized protein [Ptychodera flava]|uniref:uncharacterized protein n=1 Tax=Ptychodera flava TaxID=63121 RepID=UPI00396A93C5
MRRRAALAKNSDKHPHGSCEQRVGPLFDGEMVRNEHEIDNVGSPILSTCANNEMDTTSDDTEQSLQVNCITEDHTTASDIHENFLLSNDEPTDSTCASSDISSDNSWSDIETESDDDTEDSNDSSGDESLTCDAPELTDTEVQLTCILSYIFRHTLSGSASKDLLKLLDMICPESPVLKNIKYDNLWEMASKTNYTVQHYCVLCNHLYPSDPDIFQCNENDCEGLRYKGPYSSQMKANRQPRCYFIIADIGAQLKNILERKGVWSLIEKSKLHTRSNQQQNKIADITDGEFYRKLSQPGQFLFGENNISTIFNTDGVPLYTSTGVKLWPVFLAINELPPGHRFSRDNMILAGIWQGKNAPPFREYMNAIGVEIETYIKWTSG